MKRFFLIFLITAVLLGSLAGCKKEDSSAPSEEYQETEPPMALPTTEEIEAQLRLDAYPETSAVMSLIGQAVTFSDFSFTEETVTFTLTAPHFGDKLIAWYDGLEDIEEDDLYNQVAALVGSEPVSTTLTLGYTRQGGQLLFSYTDEYLNLAGCGIREYFNHIYTALLDEMGG